MAPFSRKAKTARNLALAEAALALARDRSGAKRPKRSRGKLLLAGGAVVAAGAAALLKRDKVAGLLPSFSGDDAAAPSPTPAPVPSQPSNYDTSGPVANTATPVPVPEPPPVTLEEEERPRIDEAAEEAAAAAEAANIGGPAPEYAGEALDEPADEAFRPLAEAGEGEAEGQEQAEADLAANAEYRDAGLSDAERQIEDVIEEAGRPSAGETPEPLVSDEPGPASKETDAEQPGAQETFL